MKLSVRSEIGKLKSVLLHRPSNEVENLTPELLERLLFDDIPYLKVAQQEHDAFAKILKDRGVEIFYLQDLMVEVLKDEEVKKQFIDEFLKEADVLCKKQQPYVKEYISSLDNNKSVVDKLMSGIRKKEINFKIKNLATCVMSDYPFICDPLPNLYFTRDPFATIENGICLNKMQTKTRCRETLFSYYIFKHHPLFKNENTPFWYNRTQASSIEGGDILILNKNTLCIGISQRTQPESIEILADNLFNNSDSHINTILAFHIPSTRAFMHLDTVFTQINHSVFTVHSKIQGPLSVYKITKKNSSLNIEKQTTTLKEILQPYCQDEVKLIKTGGGDEIISSREQWNDGSNTLAISPGEVVVYERNYVTNKILQDNGVKIHIMPSAELSRGRGGPRCMSMPLIRDEI